MLQREVSPGRTLRPPGFSPERDGAGRVVLRHIPSEDDAGARSQGDALRLWLDQERAPLIYALVAPAQAGRLAPALARAGLVRLGALLHLVRDRGAWRAACWPGGLELVPAEQVPQPELCAALDASLAGSLDWPEIQGRVPTEAMISQVHGLEPGRRDLCWVVRDRAGAPAGAVLLDRIDPETAHLSFFGLAPALRGRGLAPALLAAALAPLGPAVDVLTAVDARNLPARKLFQAADFQARRSEDLWIFPPHGPEAAI